MFLYTEGEESVRLNKNAHCFAVEPSRLTLRFRCKHLRFAIASRRSFRLPPGTPKNNRNRGCFCIRRGRSPCVLIKTHTASQSNPPCYPKRAKGTHRAAGTSLLPEAKTSHHRFCAYSKEKPSEIRTVFCCLDLLFFVEQCLVDIIAFC